MGIVIAIVVGVVVVPACMLLGFAMVRRGLRQSKEPAIPNAHVVNPKGADAAYAKAARTAGRVPQKIGNGALVVGGLALFAAPWAAMAGALRC